MQSPCPEIHQHSGSVDVGLSSPPAPRRPVPRLRPKSATKGLLGFITQHLLARYTPITKPTNHTTNKKLKNGIQLPSFWMLASWSCVVFARCRALCITGTKYMIEASLRTPARASPMEAQSIDRLSPYGYGQWEG
jgi:hypothetical protein